MEWARISSGKDQYSLPIPMVNPRPLLVHINSLCVIEWHTGNDIILAGPFDSLDVARAALLLMLEG